MKKKESPFIKVRRNLFNSNEMAQLMAEEGATGAGTYILIACHLSKCDKGVGTMNAIKQLAAQCHKSMAYVKHIIRDYHLFIIEGNTFYCPMVKISLNIEYALDSDSKQNESTSKVDSKQNESTLKVDSFHSHLVNARTSGGTKENENENEDKDKTSTPTVVEEKGGGEEAVSDFIEKVFEDDNWRNSIKVRRQIDLDDDDVMDIVKREFAECCTANNMVPHIDGFDLTQARQYCHRWLNKEHGNRRQLDQKIHEMIRRRNKNDNIVSNYSERYGFGYVIEGERYDLFGNIVPLDAPPCLDKKLRWNGREWE